MGRTLPTITQQVYEAEASMAKFRRTLRKADQFAFDGLFASARKHTAAISQTDALLPFESVLLAMLLEQTKQITDLRNEIEILKGHIRSPRRSDE